MEPPTFTLEGATLDSSIQGAIWAHGGTQMNVNVLYFDEGEGIEAHINAALDVWWVVISGEGEAVVDDIVHTLIAGTCLYIPAGATRAVRSLGGPLVYASAHAKRRGLMPEG